MIKYNRAVYTRENKPQLTWALNTPYKWYKIYVQGLFSPRLVQAAAYPGRGVLGWAYPSCGLTWTWKCSYKCTKMSAACWSRERLLHMLCFQLYPRPSRLRGARCSGGKMTYCTREPKILSKLHLIHMHPWNISFKPLDWSLTNFSSRFPTSFATAQR